MLRLGQKQKKIFLVLGVFCLFMSIYYLLVRPQVITHYENKNELAGLKSKIHMAEAIMNRKETESTLFEETSVQLGDLEELFNQYIADGLDIYNIGLLAQDTNIMIFDLRTLYRLKKEVLSEAAYILTVRGDYNDVGNFLHKLESSPFFYEIRELKVQPYFNRSAMVGGGTINTWNELTGGLKGDTPCFDGKVVATISVVVLFNESAEVDGDFGDQLNWPVGRENVFIPLTSTYDE